MFFYSNVIVNFKIGPDDVTLSAVTFYGDNAYRHLKQCPIKKKAKEIYTGTVVASAKPDADIVMKVYYSGTTPGKTTTAELYEASADCIADLFNEMQKKGILT